MKIIISHDVDHLHWKEHFFKDLFIQKWILRNSLLYLKGSITKKLLIKCIYTIFSDRLNRIKELMIFEKRYGTKATYFFGMDSALGMSYSIYDAKIYIKNVQSQGFDVGVHGVAYRDLEKIKKEFREFSRIVGENYPFGVRNHYLRRTEKTLNFQEKAGYLFDSTEYGVSHPYWMGNILEMPISLMDSYIFPEKCTNFKEAQSKTLALLSAAENKNILFFTINTHDIYFSDLFQNMKKWYIWLIEHISNYYEFSNFRRALEEILRTP